MASLSAVDELTGGAHAVAQVALENQSWVNLENYRQAGARQRHHGRQFLKTYEKKKIRGHHPKDKSHREHATTSEDCRPVRSWHTANYGWN
jgi:hypothetical protein